MHWLLDLVSFISIGVARGVQLHPEAKVPHNFGQFVGLRSAITALCLKVH